MPLESITTSSSPWDGLASSTLPDRSPASVVPRVHRTLRPGSLREDEYAAFGFPTQEPDSPRLTDTGRSREPSPPGSSWPRPSFESEQPASSQLTRRSASAHPPTKSAVNRPFLTAEVRRQIDSLDFDDVRRCLSRTFLHPGDAQSVWDILTESTVGPAACTTLQSVLEALAEHIETSSSLMMNILRLAQKYSPWESHPDPERRTAEGFLQGLPQADVVAVGLGIGTSTDYAKQSYLRTIARHWGPSWWDSVPDRLRPKPEAKACGKRLLAQVATCAKSGASLEEAVQLWDEEVRRRRDPAYRKDHGIISHRDPHLMPGDVQATVRARENSHATVPEAMASTGHYRLELRNLRPTQPSSAPPPRPPRSPQQERATKRPRRERARLPTVPGDGLGGDVLPTPRQPESPHDRCRGARVANIGDRHLVHFEGALPDGDSYCRDCVERLRAVHDAIDTIRVALSSMRDCHG